MDARSQTTACITMHRTLHILGSGGSSGPRAAISSSQNCINATTSEQSFCIFIGISSAAASGFCSLLFITLPMRPGPNKRWSGTRAAANHL
ncbi:hypothetical protein BDR04DRAFT_134603 [Suillus decipiens]|nr:hypothetical protein BDR04DRAFT_134603 [Suillus decipiens]